MLCRVPLNESLRATQSSIITAGGKPFALHLMGDTCHGPVPLNHCRGMPIALHLMVVHWWAPATDRAMGRATGQDSRPGSVPAAGKVRPLPEKVPSARADERSTLPEFIHSAVTAEARRAARAPRLRKASRLPSVVSGRAGGGSVLCPNSRSPGLNRQVFLAVPSLGGVLLPSDSDHHE